MGFGIFGFWGGPCPALETHSGKQVCGVILHPQLYAPERAREVGIKELIEAAIMLTGAGLGCDSSETEEDYDPRFYAGLRRFRNRNRIAVYNALAAWDVPINSEKNYKAWRQAHG